MLSMTNEKVIAALNVLLAEPTVQNARALEKTLSDLGFEKKVFGRLNQKSSIEAASESDRGIAERLANAFDASLTAARLAVGIEKSDRSLRPRKSAQKFVCSDAERCEWNPEDKRIEFAMPVIQFWPEKADAKQRYRKYNPDVGLASVLVRDFGSGIRRDDMPRTILDLNSDSKLKTFEAIGQFGHGGSSSLAFCESALILTKPRLVESSNQFYWTLIFPEPETDDSKQAVTRRWFCDVDGLPLVGLLDQFPELAAIFPGTSVWHFGYYRGDWINRIAGPEQKNPWGRLGRLFFSYPLPFEIRGEFARTDTKDGRRTIKGAFYRLAEKSNEAVEHRMNEKSEALVIEGQQYGQFSLFAFVLKNSSDVRNYVHPEHPVMLSLNGQNHGEMTRTLMVRANLPELASSTIVEIRLDDLDDEALSEVISNSRENPKSTPFTKALTARVIELLETDETLKDIERRRQEDKARQSSAELSKKIEKFLSSIISEASGTPGVGTPRPSPGEGGGGGHPQRPEIPERDPPLILDFIREASLFVPEGATYLAKFKSDARPPKYSFHGENPRCFALLQTSDPLANRIVIAGKGDINSRGYGSVSLNCLEDPEHPISDSTLVGTLVLRIQSTDGRILEAQLPIGVALKPKKEERKRKPEVKAQIIFGAPDEEDRVALAQFVGEEHIRPFSQCTYLMRYREALDLPAEECTYWGEKAERDGVSVLQVEINAANPQFRKLLEACKTAEERIVSKERYVRDVVLDCYQHAYSLEDVPGAVMEALINDMGNDKRRAAEIHLNHDKALRMAIHERESSRVRAS